MRLALTQSSENYAFPYRPDLKDGRDNYGGFDLVTYPEKISEIKETVDFPELRDALVLLNRPGGILVERALENRLTGEDTGNFIPFLRILLVGAIEDTCG